MSIPEKIIKAAREYASEHGDSMEVYNAFLDGWRLSEKSKKERTKELILAIKDEYPFDNWWNLYGKKVDTDKCMQKWLKMSYDERKAATERTPQYILSTPDIKYRKRPLTWLNGKCWLDDTGIQTPLKIIEANAERFMEYFNNLFAGTEIPLLTTMDERRRYLLNMAYTLHQKDILPVLDKVRDSSRLCGIDSHGRRTTFEFIFTEENFLRIKEGYYDD